MAKVEAKTPQLETVNQEYDPKAKISELKPHPSMVNVGQEDAVLSSMDAIGFYGAILAQKSTKHILAGEKRWRAARKSRKKVIPVLWVDCSNLEAVRILLADNRTADLAVRQESELTALLSDVMPKYPGVLKGTGYTPDSVDAMLASARNTKSNTTDDQGNNKNKSETVTVAVLGTQLQVDQGVFNKWLRSIELEAEEKQTTPEAVVAGKLKVTICQK